MFKLREGLLVFTALVCLAAPAAAASQPAEPSGVAKLLLDLRVRYEGYDAGGKDAEALTGRLRLGVETATYAGITGLIELEGVGALVHDYADGIRPRPWDAVIPDPEGVELNRAQVTWAPSSRFRTVVGRQRLVLNNARFVGASGWRQNEQTFDAAGLTWAPTEALDLTYAYVDDVRRTSGRDHPQGVWRSDSQLFQGDLELGAAKVSAYRYLLDFENVPGQSSATSGVRITGKGLVRPGLSAIWEAEYARQTDWGRNPADYTVDYGLLSAGLAGRSWTAALVWEQLGGDGCNSFQTPLGTLHGFQGWSDVIGATPPDGLRDVYLRGSRTFALRRPVKLAGELHEFRDDSGDRRLAREADFAVSTQLSKPLAVEAGLARFETKTPLYPDATRAWISLEFKR